MTQIRQYHESDLQAVSKLMFMNKKEGNLMSLEEAREGAKYAMVRKPDLENKYYVVELSGEVVGYCNFRDRSEIGEVFDIFVLPEHRGRGIGGKLLKAVLKYYSDKKFKIVKAETSKNDSYKEKIIKAHGFDNRGTSALGKSVWAKDLREFGGVLD